MQPYIQSHIYSYVKITQLFEKITLVLYIAPRGMIIFTKCECPI